MYASVKFPNAKVIILVATIFYVGFLFFEYQRLRYSSFLATFKSSTENLVYSSARSLRLDATLPSSVDSGFAGNATEYHLKFKHTTDVVDLNETMAKFPDSKSSMFGSIPSNNNISLLLGNLQDRGSGSVAKNVDFVHPKPEPGKPFVHAAYFLNTPGEHGDKRAAKMASVFAETLPNARLVKFNTLPLSDTRIPLDWRLPDRQVFSNKLSHVEAWAAFANDPSASNDSWAIFLEDDVSFHPDVRGNPSRANKMLDQLFELAKEQGFGYLGICQLPPLDREWKDPSKCAGRIQHEMHEGVPFAIVCGPCAHGYVMPKWKAKTFWEFLTTRPLSDSSQCAGPGGYHKMRDVGQSMFMDQNFLCYTVESQYKGAWLAGAFWGSPVYEGHFGMLYQDRSIGQSIQY